MKHVYIVVVHTEYAPPRVSQIGYDSLVKAQTFIESRADRPVKESDFLYKGWRHTYCIHELSVR